MNSMSLEGAKKLFLLSNCSKFVMAREYFLEYQIYLSLGIEKETENIWRQEQLIKYFESIKSKSEDQNLWLIYSKMYELVEAIKDQNSLLIMVNALKQINDELDQKEKIIIAETIIGRKDRSCRSGLIYMAYDIGDRINAVFFVEVCLRLVDGDISHMDLQRRAKEAKVSCIDIMDELSI